MKEALEIFCEFLRRCRCRVVVHFRANQIEGTQHGKAGPSAAALMIRKRYCFSSMSEANGAHGPQSQPVLLHFLQLRMDCFRGSEINYRG
jgi:hypothetical protein